MIIKRNITRVEYNKALDIVEAYQKQLFNPISSPSPLSADEAKKKAIDSKKKTAVRDWYLFDSCSVRLQNVLINRNGREHQVIEEITVNSFRKRYRAGEGAWNEFVSLRGY